MFDDDVTKWVFWISLVLGVIGLVSFGVLLSVVYGAMTHG